MTIKTISTVDGINVVDFGNFYTDVLLRWGRHDLFVW